jgi:3-methyl-2-oxobutanoate hydroxymethyltransferase
MIKKTTILDLQKKFRDNIPITMVTAYDYTSASSVDGSGIDMILVGDSAGMVMMGYDSTTQVTMEDMVHHCKSVKRGSKRAFIVGDMPFGSYEVSPSEAVKNATRLVKEGQVEAVKMEGGKRIREQIRAVVNAGIPVIGHIGLTPQTASALGGFKVQGKSAQQAQDLLQDALELEEAGVSAIVIESVPSILAGHITKKVNVPTIGIGAGNSTSGQVLVYHDMLGMYSDFVPKFSKQFANLGPLVKGALEQFKSEVETRSFPTPAHSYTMKLDEFNKAFPDANSEKKEEKPTYVSSILKEKKKTVAVIGGGSMGSLIGGRLAHSGQNVYLVSSWKDHVDQINERGLILQNMDSSRTIAPLKAVVDPRDVLKSAGKVDLAVVMVKSNQTEEAAKKCKELVSDDGYVLTLQNGLGNKEIISQYIRPDRIITGITSHGGNLWRSGHVIHTGFGNTSLALDGINETKAETIASMLSEAGFNCDLKRGLENLLWGKLIVNSAINPLTAILRVKNGFLADDLDCRSIVTRTVDESVAVAKKKGIQLPYDNPIDTVLRVASATRDNESSMLKDVLRGIKTEIDSINGAIVREGDRMGVNVSLNRTLVSLVGMDSLLPKDGLMALQFFVNQRNLLEETL